MVILPHANGYKHLTETLGVTGDLHLTTSKNSSELTNKADLILAAGRRVPMVVVLDGEPGILDNLGSIVGVKADVLGVRKASKCGRPVDVFKYAGVDADSIYEACGRMLSQTALENVQLSASLVAEAQNSGNQPISPNSIWPPLQ